MLRNHRIFSIFLFIRLISSIHAVTLQCDFKFDGWDFAVQNAYVCKTKSVNITSKVLITNLEGQHIQPHTNNRVNAFLIFEQNCEYFPSGIEKYFTELEGIAVQRSNLKVIRKNDLKPFLKLKSLSLFDNKLTTLEFELFKYNKNLQHLSMFSNEITNIGEGLLDGLEQLKEVYIQSNICVKDMARNKNEIDSLKKVIREKCPSTIDMKSLRDLEVNYGYLEDLYVNLKLIFNQQTEDFTVCQTMLQNATILKTTTESTAIGTTDTECQSTLAKMLKIVQKFDIQCDDFYENTCIANDVIIQHENMEPRSVSFNNGTLVEPSEMFEIEIRGKNVHFMPQNLGYFFKNIRNLTIGSSKITKIDEKSLKNLENLKTLTLANNKIRTIHENAFDSLKSCEIVDLSSNKLTDIPETLSSMYNLKDLSVEDNQISVLNWKIFENLGNLEELKINNNMLKQIGSNMELNLKSLDLTGNICVDLSFPEDNKELLINTFAENCTIEVELNCEFKAVNEDYICFAIDLNVDSQNTKISRVIGQHIAPKKSLKDVTMFSAVNQNVRFLPQNLQSFFPTLTKFEVISSNLRKFPEVKNIHWMKIVGNDLKVVENFSFDDSIGIKYIDLSNNKISQIPKDFFSNLKYLTYLNLNGNLLTSIGENLIPVENSIEEFYCNENKLEKIANKFIKDLKAAQVIELSGNTCVDNKFSRKNDIAKKYMELYGEVDLNC